MHLTNNADTIARQSFFIVQVWLFVSTSFFFSSCQITTRLLFIFSFVSCGIKTHHITASRSRSHSISQVYTNVSRADLGLLMLWKRCTTIEESLLDMSQWSFMQSKWMLTLTFEAIRSKIQKIACSASTSPGIQCILHGHVLHPSMGYWHIYHECNGFDHVFWGIYHTICRHQVQVSEFACWTPQNRAGNCLLFPCHVSWQRLLVL